MMRNKNFAAFILTHGRPDNVITLSTLRRRGYTGKVYFIVDNEDKHLKKYIENFSIENVKVFDKKQYADKIDEGNNFDERRTITHARNASFDIARDLGLKEFIQLDDDYVAFTFRFEVSKSIISLDNVFDNFLDFYKSCNIKSLALSQGGDHIGGFKQMRLKRKAMNSFICSVDRPFSFVGAMNEDVNTYTTLGSRGVLFFTFTSVQLNQKETQSQAGGITDMYLAYGTYCKAFTTVMMSPSSVKIREMGQTKRRLHHSIKWNNTVPKIISEGNKKK